MVRLQDVTFSYSGQAPLFENFSFYVRRGEAWAVIGPSGCGKTTLLYLLAGLKHPASGRILVSGEPVSRPRPRTGLVLQDHGLLPWATVRENARLGLSIREFYGPDGLHAPRDMEGDKRRTEKRIDDWLEWLGIAGLQAKYPSQLSRGQRQRTAIARTLALDPDLLLMDEPFSALDAPIRHDLQRVMIALHRESHLTSITVTHDIEEAVILGKRILALRGSLNTHPHILDNALAWGDAPQRGPEFRQKCEELRTLLGTLS